MKRKILITILTIVILVTSVLVFTSCNQSETVNYNIKKDADNFAVYRRMTFINLRTDKILYAAEGYFSLHDSSTNEISITFKVSENEYSLNYFLIGENVVYVIEQIENTTTDPYHWHIYWYVPVPDIVDYN